MSYQFDNEIRRLTMRKQSSTKVVLNGVVIGCSLFLTVPAYAGTVSDQHGNVGYDTVSECVVAVTAGTAKFYHQITENPPLKREGEADVKVMPLSGLVSATEAANRLGYDASGYTRGACDLGVGHSQGRDGVTPELRGKYVPYSPEMLVNVYYNAQNVAVRASMKQCDNHFSERMPRPIPAAHTSNECFAMVAIAPKFETRTEQVVKVPATTRYEVVPATYKSITEQVLVSPAYTNQIPVPATYKTVTEDVVVKAAGVREEPMPATYKTVKDQIVFKPASKRIEAIQCTYKTVTEQVMLLPEHKELKVIPAVYGMKEETVADRPVTTRVVTTPATFKSVTEKVVFKPESVRYEPIALPLRTISESVILEEASSRIEATAATYRTVTERVLVKEACKRLVEQPALFETVTECVKVADASTEWKRGRAWLAKAINVRPARGFEVGADGRVEGSRVDPSAAANVNANFGDEVMCLVEIPERCETVTRQVLKAAAAVREMEIPAEYATVTRQVMDHDATTRKVDIPATYQTVTSQIIDIEKLRTLGYRINGNSDIEATPSGERVLRASAVAGTSAERTTEAAKADASYGAKPHTAARSGPAAYVREIIIPAEYHTVTRQVIDQPATVRVLEVPGSTKVVKRRVVVTPARTEEVVILATYKTVTREVIDTPASTREFDVPAEYKTVERRVVDTPASIREIPVAAVLQKLSRRVIDTPATTRDETVPVVYKTVTREVIDVPANTRAIDVPAQYETLTLQYQVAEPTTQRRSVLCETNANPSKIMEIQHALQKAGFNPGRVDGMIGADTVNAIKRFQQSKGLPVNTDGRYLDVETVKALGVSPN
jgi:hypothetical protein